MSTEIRVPNLGESVTEATVAQWFKKPGETVAADEPLVELETDKVSVEVPAPAGGTLGEIAAADGTTVEVGALLGSIEGDGAGAGNGAARAAPKPQPAATAEPATDGGGAPAADAAPAPPGREKAEPAEVGKPRAGGAEVEILVPALGESVTEATVSAIHKGAGSAVSADEPLVELETDKVTVDVPAPAAGVLAEIDVKVGDTVAVGSVLGRIGAGAGAAGGAAPAATVSPPTSTTATAGFTTGAGAPAVTGEAAGGMPPSPAARKHLEEAGLAADAVPGTGRRGQVLKEDVMRAVESGESGSAAAPAAAEPRAPAPSPAPAPAAPAARPAGPAEDEAREERVRMTRLRQTIARRLKDAQNTAAMLTTFNDVDMKALMDLRKSYKDLFEKKHGVKLGFMGLFVQAVVQALKDVPAVNAEIDGQDLVYKNYYHIGVAVGTDKGLVVPVVREADGLSVAGIEKAINDFGRRARDGSLKLEEMQGGTFTISNGGVYGSLLSTPILNAPQSGILGMHRIEERPVVRGGEIVVRPMMYLALSYDHRIVDGKEAVTFLVRVKEAIEDPERLLLDL